MCHDVMWHMAPADDEDIPSLSQYPTLSPRSSAPVSPLQLQLDRAAAVRRAAVLRTAAPAQQLTHPGPSSCPTSPTVATQPLLYLHTLDLPYK